MKLSALTFNESILKKSIGQYRELKRQLEEVKEGIEDIKFWSNRIPNQLEYFENLWVELKKDKRRLEEEIAKKEKFFTDYLIYIVEGEE